MSNKSIERPIIDKTQKETESLEGSFFALLKNEYGKLLVIIARFGNAEGQTTTQAEKLRRKVIFFWQNYAKTHQPIPGSFGLDKEGTEQPALCYTILDDAETSICRLGLELDSQGERKPNMDIKSFIITVGEVFDVKIGQNSLEIEYDSIHKPLFKTKLKFSDLENSPNSSTSEVE